MQFAKVLAVVPVTDLDPAIDFYTRIFGREPDARPMAGLADWHVTDTAWVQVFLDTEHAGSTLLNLAVEDLDSAIVDLTGRGLEVGEVTGISSGGKLAGITDPVGNRITLIQSPTQ